MRYGMKFLSRASAFLIVIVSAFILCTLALKSDLVPENVRKPIIQVSRQVQTVVAQFAGQIGFESTIDTEKNITAEQALVKTPTAAENATGMWGKTGMQGLPMYEYGKTLLNSSERAIYCQIADAETNVQKTLAFKSTMTPVQIEKIYDYFISDHAEVFYDNGVQYDYLHYGKSYSYKITFKYEYGGSKNKIAAMRAQLRQKALNMLNCTKGSATDLEKEKALHDALVKTCSYDDNAAENSDAYPEAYSAYGALVKGKSVCQGYAQAMKLLLSYCGIKSLYVSGEAEGGDHAWNEVQIGGKWYSLDVTFDDPVYTDQFGNSTTVDTISYKYFNFTQKLDHILGKFCSADPLSPTCENYANMPKIG